MRFQWNVVHTKHLKKSYRFLKRPFVNFVKIKKKLFLIGCTWLFPAIYSNNPPPFFERLNRWLRWGGSNKIKELGFLKGLIVLRLTESERGASPQMSGQQRTGIVSKVGHAIVWHPSVTENWRSYTKKCQLVLMSFIDGVAMRLIVVRHIWMCMCVVVDLFDDDDLTKPKALETTNKTYIF